MTNLHNVPFVQSEFFIIRGRTIVESLVRSGKKRNI